MQTLKTAIVVVLLLVVFYGVYEMLNRPPVEPPAGVPDMAEGDFDVDVDLGVSPGEDEVASSISEPEVSTGSQFPVYGYQTGATDTSSAPAGGAYNPPADPATAYGIGPAPDTIPPTTPPVDPHAADTASSLPATMPPSPGSPSAPLADAEVYVTPGSPQMQFNPHVNDEAVPKPEMAGSAPAAMGAALYKHALAKARGSIADGDYVSALHALSVFYKSPELTAEQHQELLDLLDALAGRVVYSREHLLAPPFKVARGQTLADIAQLHSVPQQLLQKINGIENPNVLLPGTELKIVPGPFSADVDLAGQELTLFVDGLYAGRFPISLGADPLPKEGEFHVRDKQLGRTYFALDGRTIPADNPNNPFGRVWMDLGRDVCIHGSAMAGSNGQQGCISLSPRDADDVYSILSVGSKVRILR